MYLCRRFVSFGPRELRRQLFFVVSLTEAHESGELSVHYSHICQMFDVTWYHSMYDTEWRCFTGSALQPTSQEVTN